MRCVTCPMPATEILEFSTGSIKPLKIAFCFQCAAWIAAGGGLRRAIVTGLRKRGHDKAADAVEKSEVTATANAPREAAPPPPVRLRYENGTGLTRFEGRPGETSEDE